MGFLCGLVGAILGTFVVCAAAFLRIAARSDGNTFADGIGFAASVPLGLLLGSTIGIAAALGLRRYVRKNWANRQARRKIASVITASVLAVPLSITVMLWSALRCNEPPADQKLLDNFKRHQTEFSALAQLAQTDKCEQWITPNEAGPNAPLAGGSRSRRIDSYRRLMKIADVLLMSSSDPSGKTMFVYWEVGSAISSDRDKGYAYLTTPPKQTLKSLDDCRPDETNEVLAYRHIEGCWYLYYDYLPD